jgi:DUF3043 family protein
MFRRKSADLTSPADSGTADDAALATMSDRRSRSYTPTKGKATPKRMMAGRRTVEPPPANRREALRRARAKQRENRAEVQAGRLAGKEEYLLPRDKGPERALVRDIVDSRRNIASYFLVGALVVIVGSSQVMPPVVQVGANVFWGVLAAAVVVDSVLLARKVRRMVAQRFPASTTRHTWYAIMRSIALRRMRMPAPRVRLGDTI